MIIIMQQTTVSNINNGCMRAVTDVSKITLLGSRKRDA